MLQLKVVEGGFAKTLSLDAPGVTRPLRMKALSGGKYAVAIPVEGEALAKFPPGYVMKRVGNNLILMKDGQEMLVLEGFFSLEPMPEFRLAYDDELLLISVDNVDAYPSEGVRSAPSSACGCAKPEQVHVLFLDTREALEHGTADECQGSSVLLDHTLVAASLVARGGPNSL